MSESGCFYSKLIFLLHQKRKNLLKRLLRELSLREEKKSQKVQLLFKEANWLLAVDQSFECNEAADQDCRSARHHVRHLTLQTPSAAAYRTLSSSEL